MMQIQTNLPSLYTQRKLSESSAQLGTLIQRLSTGTRINSAKDDAARLAITERFTSQVRGNTQTLRNINDGVSMLQVAEGATGNVIDSLQRIRELAVQANNASLSASDRQALQAEANQLLQGIDKIGQQTVFNDQQVFSQNTSSLGGDENQRAVIDGLKLGWLQEAEARIKQFYGIEGDGATLTVDLTFTDGAGSVAAQVSGTGGAGGKVYNQKLEIDMADFTPPNLPNGGNAPFYNDRIIAHEMVHAVMGRSINMTAMPTWFLEGTAELIHGADERLAGDIAASNTATIVNTIAGAWGSTSADYSSAYAATRYLHDQLKGMGVEDGIKGLIQELASSGSTLDAALNTVTSGVYATEGDFVTDWQANGAAYITGTMNLTNTDTGGIGGLDADGGAEQTAESVYTGHGSRYGEQVLDGFKLAFPTLGGGTDIRWMDLQVGANARETIKTGFAAMNSSALGVSDVDLDKLPSFALVHVDQALDFVNRSRAEMGATLSRLEFTAAKQSISIENLSTARSRMRDTDYAEETAGLARQQILQQSASAMLAQANQVPQLVLSLLR